MNYRKFVQGCITRSRAHGYQTDVNSALKLEMRMRKMGWICYWCGAPAVSIDHVIPLISGGPDLMGNLVPCCKQCNDSKSCRMLRDWRPGIQLTDEMKAIAAWRARRDKANFKWYASEYQVSVEELESWEPYKTVSPV